MSDEKWKNLQDDLYSCVNNNTHRHTDPKVDPVAIEKLKDWFVDEDAAEEFRLAMRAINTPT